MSKYGEIIIKIHFERTGGFGGMHLSTTIDTDALSSDEAKKIKEMVIQTGFFNLPDTIALKSTGADRFQYKLTVEEDNKVHTVLMDERAMPVSVRPLIELLTARAKSARPDKH